MKLFIKMVCLGAGTLATLIATEIMAVVNVLMAIPLLPVLFVLLHCFLKTVGEILAE